MANKVELILTNNLGISTSVDILDFPYRLNRTSFTTSEDKLKVLGGSFSTTISLAKSKKNNVLFTGKSQLGSLGKFDMSSSFKAKLFENGAQVMIGTFKLEEITAREYKGTFFDQDINWVDRLSNIRLNQLGYINGQPTWTAPFNGAISFNVVNELNNRQTDYLCPTLIYNNTPITDYLDFTDDDIWGTFELPLAPIPVRLTNGMTFPDDFITQTGYFGDRLGLTYEDFPPALYYRNVIEKCFEEIGMAVDCPLFAEDWFNKIYMTYSGNGYVYNWGHIATVASYTPTVNQTGFNNFDTYMEAEPLDLQNTPPLPLYPWIANPKGLYKQGHIILHDDYTSLIYEDYITAHNKFGIPRQYICPTNGNYKIKVGAGYENVIQNFHLELGGTLWDGWWLFWSYATQDPNSSWSSHFTDRDYACDDNVMIVMRKNESDNYAYADTEKMLTDWMSGSNKDMTINPSDIIAYFSPKRYEKYIGGTIANIKEAVGSPITNWNNDVTVHRYSHQVTAETPLVIISSESYAEIEIECELMKNERIEIYWIAIGNIQGNALGIPGAPFTNGVEPPSQIQNFGEGVVEPLDSDHYFIIEELCHTEELDLAGNLPSMSAKDFIAQFIKQFNLHFIMEGNTVIFIPQQAYYTPETYDITPRVVDQSWVANPVDSAASWEVGYNNDVNDRLLNGSVNVCDGIDIIASNYGNVIVTNDNVNGTDNLSNFNMFSATQFYQGLVNVQDLAIMTATIPTSTDPESGYVLDKGFNFTYGPIDFPVQFPSIQSDDSFNQRTVGDLTYQWNYKPRLLYHLGTINTYLAYSPDYMCLIDSPRADVTFMSLPKHWYRPTVSAFDTENGNIYRTLRYDTANGLFNTYFENLIDIYNQSEIITLDVSLRNIDWLNMTGSKKIKYKDMLYRLMTISNYSPLDNRPCKVTLLREI